MYFLSHILLQYVRCFVSNNSEKSMLVINICPQISVFAPDFKFRYLRSDLKDYMSKYKERWCNKIGFWLLLWRSKKDTLCKQWYLNKQHFIEKIFQSNITFAHTTYKHQSHLNIYGFYKKTIIQVRTRWTLINTQSTHTN